MIRRIVAWIGLGLLAALYLLTAAASFLARPEATNLFMASLAMTFVIPVLLWSFLKMYENSQKKDSISMREMRKINKRIKAGENPAKIAKELEEKYEKK